MFIMFFVFYIYDLDCFLNCEFSVHYCTEISVRFEINVRTGKAVSYETN